MSKKNIILLFKKDTGMDNVRWKRFCHRYKGKNVDSIVQECAVRYKGVNKRKFKEKLVQAINDTSTTF